MTQHAPVSTERRPEQPSNGLGTAGFVVGLIGLLFSFIPVVGVVAWPLVILGIIFSAIGLNKAVKGRATNKGLAIAGLTLSIIGLVICIVWAAALGNAVNDVNEEANRDAVILYEVSGDAKGVNVAYTTFGDGVTTSQETVAALPWNKEVKTKGYVKGGTLTVMTGEQAGSVTCKVSVDGKVVKTATASGAFATASCGGF